MCSRPWCTSSAGSTDGRPDCGCFQRAGGTVKQLEKQAQHLASGPVDITWHPESRLAVVRYTPDTTLVGEDGTAARGSLRSKGVAI